MTEQRRLEYLDALGIEQFVPRKVLPGAKPSLALIRTAIIDTAAADVTSDSVAHPEIQPLPLTDHAVKPVAALVEQVTTRLASPDATTAFISQPTKQPPRPQSSLVPPQRVLRFALTVWHLPGWLWIDSRQSQQALPTDALLHNILFALKINQPVKAEVITWPPVESPLQTQDWPEARDMLNSFLAPRLNAGERLILLGEAAYNACTQGPFDYAERLAQGLPLQHPTNPCLLLPSLAQLLNQPALKAGMWQQLLNIQQQQV